MGEHCDNKISFFKWNKIAKLNTDCKWILNLAEQLYIESKEDFFREVILREESIESLEKAAEILLYIAKNRNEKAGQYNDFEDMDWMEF